MANREQTYPNQLGVFRRKYGSLSQSQLSVRCAQLFQSQPDQFVTVSVSTIKALEAGRRQPLMATAVTIATVISTTVEELFPLGCANPNRNPSGRTHISPDRPRGGRPRKSKQ